MRDLATYEHNFSIQRSEFNNMNLRERLTKAIAMIQDARNYCNKSLSLSELERLRSSNDSGDHGLSPLGVIMRSSSALEG